MPVSKRLRQFLDDEGIRYDVYAHPEAYTAQGVAAATHIPGREVAKTVIARRGDQFMMIVLSAPARVNFDVLSEELGGERIRLATEEEFRGLFPDCELGAMPPFGNLYEIPVYVDEALSEDEEIAFNAGTHKEVIRMRYADFEKLVNPAHVRFSMPR